MSDQDLYFDRLVNAITQRSSAVGSIQLNGTLNTTGRNDYITVNFPNGATFKSKKLALNYLALYYAWNNIQNNAPAGLGYQNYNNAYIQYEWIDTTVNKVTYADGMYQITDISNLMNSIMITNGHYLVQYENGLVLNSQTTFLSIVANITYNAFQIISTCLPSALAVVTGTDASPVAPNSGYLLPYVKTPTTAAITSLSQSGTTVTITAANSFTNGQSVFFSGFPSGGSFNYMNNNSYTVASASGTGFQVTTATSQTVSSTNESYAVACLWGASLTNGYGPALVVPNTGMVSLLGFAAGNYPPSLQTSNYAILSTKTPIISPIISVNVNCSLISNPFNSSFQSIFQFTPNVSFAQFMSFSPTFPVYFKINDGNYSQISVWFSDQNGYPIYINDPEIVITLLIADA
jgi:hypothetical protein